MSGKPFVINYKPFPKQEMALDKLRDNITNEVLFGGGARGGKTYFGCCWIIIECLSKPGSQWLIGRDELKKLRQTTLITFFDVIKDFNIPPAWYKYNQIEGIITWTNGSRIFLADLGYKPSDPNYDRLGSYGLTGAFIDEAQEVNEKVISVLRGRFSVLKGENWETIPKSLYTCNPAKNWIYRDFYKPFVEGTIDKTKTFIPSLVTDNPTISQDYIENLKKSDNITVQRLLYGNFEYDDTPGKLFAYNDIVNMFVKKDKTFGNKYISADIARHGQDKTVIYVWRGFTLIDYKVIDVSGLDFVVSEMRKLEEKYNVPHDNIIADEAGIGGGVVDFYKIKGFIGNQTPVSPFGSIKRNYLKRNYQNLKTQCYFELSKYVKEGIFDLSIIQDIDIQGKITQELDCITQVDIDNDGKLKIIPKPELKERLGRSPDFSDAIMMRMYFELVRPPEIEDSVYTHEEIEDDPYVVNTEIGLFEDAKQEGSIDDVYY